MYSLIGRKGGREGGREGGRKEGKGRREGVKERGRKEREGIRKAERGEGEGKEENHKEKKREGGNIFHHMLSIISFHSFSGLCLVIQDTHLLQAPLSIPLDSSEMLKCFRVSKLESFLWKSEGQGNAKMLSPSLKSHPRVYESPAPLLSDTG